MAVLKALVNSDGVILGIGFMNFESGVGESVIELSNVESIPPNARTDYEVVDGQLVLRATPLDDVDVEPTAEAKKFVLLRKMDVLILRRTTKIFLAESTAVIDAALAILKNRYDAL